MKFLNIGFGNLVNPDSVLSITEPDSAPIKRFIQDCKEKGTLIDASFGRSTRSVIFSDCGYVILSSISPEILSGRLNETEEIENNG